MRIINCKIITDGTLLENQTIQIEDGIIKGLSSMDELQDGDVDLKNMYISPGFIDIQIYGAGGVMFQNNLDEKSLKTMSDALLNYGVTNFLPATTSTSIDNFSKAFTGIKTYTKQVPNNVLGINIEGPAINETKAGFHDKNYVNKNIDDFFDFLVTHDLDTVFLTAAPENLPDLDYKNLEEKNIYVSIGHSTSSYEETRKIIDKGVKRATHIFNGMSNITGREPGIVGCILTDTNIFSSLIADGVHVHEKSVALACRVKEDKLYLISDGMPPIGSNDMSEFLYEETKIINKDGSCKTEDGVLAGTPVDVFTACKNIMSWTGLSIEKAVKLITQNPANAINMSNKYGRIAPGFCANMTIFDDNLQIIGTILNGQLNWN